MLKAGRQILPGENLMKLINIANATVFLCITASIASIFYEGLTLEWYSFVSVLMLVADGSFILATILHLIFKRKNRTLFILNIFSAVLIVIALVAKFAGIDYPKWAIVIWYFYILFLYGIQVTIAVYKCLTISAPRAAE